MLFHDAARCAGDRAVSASQAAGEMNGTGDAAHDTVSVWRAATPDSRFSSTTARGHALQCPGIAGAAPGPAGRRNHAGGHAVGAAISPARFGHLVDRFIEFPGYPGLPEQPVEGDAVEAFLARMRGEAFDLVIQMHGSGEVTNPLVEQFGAKQTAGFYRAGQSKPDGGFLPWSERHEIHQLLDLMAFLGMPKEGEELEFPVADSERAAVRGSA